ncbi:GntR family transcriptional regulator [Aeromonas molluscorum 848]|uniref:GntR family transcriptional regulator n=1 Tax=Aeromonas molluscorum 848 TaxID=1268236 RepID=R1GZJ1_9GAMM|nr:GntR family transcriptional regulator [Aeromonas molluscorum 848]
MNSLLCSSNVAIKWPCHADQFCQYEQTNFASELPTPEAVMSALPTLFANQQRNDLPLHEQLVPTLGCTISASNSPQAIRRPS